MSEEKNICNNITNKNAAYYLAKNFANNTTNLAKDEPLLKISPVRLFKDSDTALEYVRREYMLDEIRKNVSFNFALIKRKKFAEFNKKYFETMLTDDCAKGD